MNANFAESHKLNKNIYLRPIAQTGILLLLSISACTSTLPVRSDYDKQADFSHYRTFTWLNENPITAADGRSPEISALTLSRIVSAIEAELEYKGYNKAAVGEKADFAVAFTVGTRERIDVDSYPLAYRGPWHWHSTYWDYDISTRTYQEGMLGVDIFDESSHQPVWHGFTYKRITGSVREDPAPVIRDAVSAVLAEFPPPD